jgi:hypothetical protein|tara:strand:- start:988 stop:1161 length:174 start_codon:yes stop_codon:yes gene_type:complete
MEKLIRETLEIAAQLVSKSESKTKKLTKRMLVNDLKMIKLNLMMIQDDITRQSKQKN